MNTKTCSKCSRDLPTSQFYRDSRAVDGLYSTCKLCHKEHTEDWRAENPDKPRKYAKNNYESNPQKVIKRVAAYRARPENIDKVRAWNNKYKEKIRGTSNPDTSEKSNDANQKM